MRTVTTLAALAISAACINASVQAETTYLAELYGEGVHYFYSGDLIRAEKFFDQAILLGSKDPRCYYYRAMLHIYRGCCYNAEDDIRLGAQYELEGRGTYDIGAALYRIQGHQRIEFERMRRDAKLEVVLSGGASATSPEESYLPPSTTVVPGIPPGLTDPFADEAEEVELPVDDVEPEVDADEMFGEEVPADDQDVFDDAPTDDAGLESDTLEAGPEAPVDESDPFAEDAFSVEDDNADGLFDDL